MSKDTNLTSHSTAKAAIFAGLLALTLAPTTALAEPAGPGAPQAQGANPPAMEQGMPQGGGQGEAAPTAPQAPTAPTQDKAPALPQRQDAPSDPQAPSAPQQGETPTTSGEDAQKAPAQPNQQPQGMPGREDDGIADDIRKVLADTYGIDTTAPGTGAKPSEAPELPSGAINVQQVIDSARDALRSFVEGGAETIDLDDEDVAAAVTAQVKAQDAQRQSDFASGKTQDGPQEAQKELPSEAGEATDATRPADKPETSEEALPAPAAESGILAALKSDSGLIGKLVSFIVNLFA